MPESNDWPPERPDWPHGPRRVWPEKPQGNWPRPPGGRRRVLLLLAIIAAVIFAFRTAFSYYVDSLWYGSLGYSGVFWKTQGLQWATFVAFAVVTFLILYGSFLAMKRAYFPELQGSHTIFIGGQSLKLPVAAVVRVVAPIVS